MTQDIKVPDIGDFTDVPVVSILVSVGDTVAEEDPLIELESDKATMEVPSPAAGTVKEIKVAEGDKVSEGSLIMVFDSAESSGEAPKADQAKTPRRKRRRPRPLLLRPLRPAAPAPAVTDAGFRQGPREPVGARLCPAARD